MNCDMYDDLLDDYGRFKDHHLRDRLKTQTAGFIEFVAKFTINSTT